MNRSKAHDGRLRASAYWPLSLFSSAATVEPNLRRPDGLHQNGRRRN